jgi:hypothetical protein
METLSEPFLKKKGPAADQFDSGRYKYGLKKLGNTIYLMDEEYTGWFHVVFMWLDL